jgi:hypothetical protein
VRGRRAGVRGPRRLSAELSDCGGGFETPDHTHESTREAVSPRLLPETVKLTNRHGMLVDPVPFLVVSSLAFLVSFSYGPIYLLALGLSLPVALAVSGVLFVCATGAAYHQMDQMVLTTRPALRGEIPPERRLRRLVYAVVVGLALVVLLSLPFLVP